MDLPYFKYHPKPLETGNVVESADKCECCNKARGYMYAGPIYAEDEFEAICPWCIADGSAHEELDVAFTDDVGVGGDGLWEEVDEEIVAEVATRTPGFSAWQQEQWATCCEDACAYLGRAGKKELTERWAAALSVIQENSEMEDDEWDEYLDSLDAEGSPTAYVFQCLHCKKFHAFQDSN